MPEDEAKKVCNIFKDIMGAKKPIVDLENCNFAKDGRKILLMTNGKPVLSEKGELLGYRGVDEDITEYKNWEKEIKNRAEDLERSNRLMIGHEIKMIELKKRIKELEDKK